MRIRNKTTHDKNNNHTKNYWAYFCHTVADNIGSMFQRLLQVGSGKGTVDHEGQSDIVCFVGNLFDIEYVETGIGTGFREEATRLVVGHFGEISGIGPVDESNFDAELRQERIEHAAKKYIHI